MYKQSIQNIRLAIFPLDGIILDLNRLRYNYYKHLANDYNISVSRQEFSASLCNMYDMYQLLPLHKCVDSGPLNAKIERELLEYSRYKGMKVKEGVFEFIECLKQKDIPIAVFSTHRTKDACEYLKMVGLYHKVHFIIGSDTSSLPLPSSSILETICEYFKVACQDTLVLSSFECLNKVASSLHMNILYLDDFVAANDFIEQTSYRIVHTMFEALNIMLFDKYEDVDMYSPLLGMDENMSEGQLKSAYQNAVEIYNNDQGLMDVVDRTYHYHLSQLRPHKVYEKKHFTFEDDKISQDEVVENVQEDVLKNINEAEIDTSQDRHLHAMSLEDEEELTTLLQQISKKSQPIEVVEEDDEEEIIEKESESTKHYSFFQRICVQFVYILLISLFLLLIGITFSIAFIYPLQEQSGIFGFITQFFNLYYCGVQMFFETLFNTLHQLFSFIPSYEMYTHMVGLSIDGLELFHIYIMNCLVLSLFSIAYYFIKKGMRKDVQEN